MKLRTLLLASVLCSAGSGAGAYALTPARLPGGARLAEGKGAEVAASVAASLALPAALEAPPSPRVEPWRVAFDGALVGSMTLGHSALAAGEAVETLVLLEMIGGQRQASKRPPAHLSLVIDRSGSMEGERWRRALDAAVGALRLLDGGDIFSLVAFGDTASVVIEPTQIDEQTRAQAEAKIRAMKLGGDTCISCGIEASRKLLAGTPGHLQRMILMSDGEANVGLIKLPAFSLLVGQVRDGGATLATVGLGSRYNEKLMTALAMNGNGSSYDVATEAGLSRVFEAEAAGLRAVVASDAALEVELGPGVELVRVYDRTFRREGSRLLVPLGLVRQGERKVVLASVKVPAGASGEVARARLRFQDLTTGGAGLIEGALAAERTEASGELLPAAARWALGSQSNEIIVAANAAFAQGKSSDAQRQVDAQLNRLRAEKERAERLKDAPAAAALGGQIQTMEIARKSYSSVPHASPIAARQIKENHYRISGSAAY